MKKCILSLVLAFSVLLASCTQNQIITDLNYAVTGAEALIPFIPNLSPATQALVQGYVQDVSVDLSESIPVIESATLTTSQKALEVTQIFANVVATKVQLPPGTDPKVVSLVQGLASAVSTFLQNFIVPQGVAVSAPKHIKLSNKDVDSLDKLLKRTLVVVNKTRK